jgi:hypothetical protein
MAKKPTTPQPTAPTPKKLSRMAAAAMAIRSMTDQTTTEHLVRAADAFYTESGGTSDIQKSRDWVNDVLKVAQALGVIAVEEHHTKTISRKSS